MQYQCRSNEIQLSKVKLQASHLHRQATPQRRMTLCPLLACLLTVTVKTTHRLRLRPVIWLHWNNVLVAARRQTTPMRRRRRRRRRQRCRAAVAASAVTNRARANLCIRIATTQTTTLRSCRRRCRLCRLPTTTTQTTVSRCRRCLQSHRLRTKNGPRMRHPANTRGQRLGRQKRRCRRRVPLQRAVGAAQR